MKKKYIAPSQTVVQMISESAFLAISDMDKDIEVKLSDDVANGAEALSNRRHEIWGSADIWD